MKHVLIAAAAALPLVAGVALASDDAKQESYCGRVAADQWMSAADVVAKAAELGYRDIREVEKDDGCWEIEAVDAEGRSVELYLHPASGEVAKLERD